MPDKDNNKNIPCQQTDDRGRMVVENGRLYCALGKNMILVSEHFNQNGKDLEERAEKYVIGLFGSGEKKTASEEIDKAKKAFIASNEYVLVDPLDILEKINTLEEEIASFTAEIDAVLSESNAITQITVEY